MPSILIRLGIYKDAEDIASVGIQAWQESYKGIVDQNYLDNLSYFYEARLAYLKEALQSQEKPCFVVEDQNKIVGFCEVGHSYGDTFGFCKVDLSHDDTRGKGRVYAIYLLEAYKNQGIGTALWTKAMSYFKEHNLLPFDVWTLKDNIHAKQFYEKQGGKFSNSHFIKIGCRPYEAVCYLFEL